ncbi:hypothetical protein [Macrococcus armenti]|nr:hypothetical protein [Macrococcus armenti]UBH18757.1 hypothetical protein LAU39_05455 [Macrococcus armenti]
MYTDRCRLIKSIVTRYDPNFNENRIVYEYLHDDVLPCKITGMNNRRIIELFGKLGDVNTVVRFLNSDIPKDAQFIEAGERKFKVTSSAIYPNDAVLYCKEVTEW